MLNVRQNNGLTDKLSWIFDTGASSTHFCNNLNLFTSYKPLNNSKMSLAVHNATSNIKGIGNIKFSFLTNNKMKEIELKNVMFSPYPRRNLLSGPKLEQELLSVKMVKFGYILKTVKSYFMLKELMDCIFVNRDIQNAEVEIQTQSILLPRVIKIYNCGIEDSTTQTRIILSKLV